MTPSSAGVGFQLEGVMPTMACLTWEQAKLLGADLDRACEDHEKELSSEPSAK
ncbi:MAG: hypothetical protein KGJ23_04995 [Euryarchaeota archaeon]|nr:hypothetical protein [Euryarchaeota archaeon]MDE1880627.1 hypothetical protein [Euryarchaeota archaeon]MDE2044367.1 hypothetical protein [Thermoplasmata archaeon]